MGNNTTKPFYNTTIPSDWKELKVKDVATIKGGYAFDSLKFRESGKYQVVKMSNVYDNILDLNRSKSFLENLSEQEKEFIIKKDDIIITLTGTIGKRDYGYSYQIKNESNLLLNQRIAKISVNSADSKYLFYEVKTNRFLNQFFLSARGGTGNQANVGTQDLATLKIILPSLPEQRAIAHVLSLMDSAINQNNQLIVQKELRKKWLMQNLLTGKKRLNLDLFDLHDDPDLKKEKSSQSFNPKNHGSDNWKKIGAGEIFKSISVKGFEDEELLSATQDRGIIPRTMLDGRVTMPDGTTAGYKLVEPGDFVISLRSFQGGLEYSYYRGIVSPAYIVLKSKKKINDEFYKQYYKSYEFIGRLATAVIGIRDGKQVSYDDYCIVKIPFPSFEEQTAIAQVLQAADKEIQLLKAKTAKLREQKKGMMQVLLTGKKRLKIENE